MSSKQSRGDVEDTTTRKAENELDTVVTFDYAALDAETRIVVQQRTGEIRRSMNKSVENIIDVGKGLIDVKSKLEHGQWKRWLDFEFGWSDQTARNFMNVAEKFGQIQNGFEFAAKALYLLARPSTPEHARRAAVALAESGQKVTHQAAKVIIDQHRPISYTPKEDDGYRDDVPAVKVGSMSDEPAITPTGRLPQPTPFKATHVITPQHNGDTPAVAPDGRKPDNVSTSGAINRTNGEAPRSPSMWHTYARGEYWDVVDPNGRRVFAGQIIGAEGQLLANEFARLKNAHTAPVEVKHEETKPETLPFSQINELGIKPDDLNTLISAHNKATKTNKGFDRVASILRYIREMEINPVDPLGYIKGELERASGKKSKKEKTPTTPRIDFEPMVNAIVKVFRLDPEQITEMKWGEINRAAKQLCTVKALPEDVAGIHQYCFGRFEDNFGPNALAKYYADWKAEQPKPAPAPAPHEEYVPMPEAAKEAWRKIRETFNLPQEATG